MVEDFADAFQFILSFNAHFESNESTVIQALHKNPPITFGQLLTMQLNRCRADNKGRFRIAMEYFFQKATVVYFLPKDSTDQYLDMQFSTFPHC